MFDLVGGALSEISWLAMLGITSFGVKLLADLSKSVDGLNVHIVKMIDKINFHEDRLDNHESRLGRLENGKTKKKS